MLRLYRDVIKGRRVEDKGQSPAQNQLKLSGLVKADGGVLRVRNRIYERVFDAAWVKQNTPVNWAGIMTAVAAVAVVVAVVALGLIGYNAWVNSQVEANVDTFANRGRPWKQRLAGLARIFRLSCSARPKRLRLQGSRDIRHPDRSKNSWYCSGPMMPPRTIWSRR